MNVISYYVIRNAQFFRYCNPLHWTRQACEQTHPVVADSGEPVKERRAVIWEYALL